MTDEQASAKLKAAVEALFLDARMAERHEMTAYVEAGDPAEPLGSGRELVRYVYVAFRNGRREKDLIIADPAPDYSWHVEGLIGATCNAITAEFPCHASMAMIWRNEPECQWVQQQKAGGNGPAEPPHWETYARLICVPVGTVGNDLWCDVCGVQHPLDADHHLTEHFLDHFARTTLKQFREEGIKLFVTREEIRRG